MILSSNSLSLKVLILALLTIAFVGLFYQYSYRLKEEAEILSAPPKSENYRQTFIPGTPQGRRVRVDLDDIISKCPGNATAKLEVDETQLNWKYQSPLKPLVLYHGTSLHHARNILAAGGPTIISAKDPVPGSLSSQGAFYMTESWAAAAQYAKVSFGNAPIAVISFKWNPEGMFITEFNYDTPEAERFLQDFMWWNWDGNPALSLTKKSDMIAAPLLHVKGVTRKMWQYAIVRPNGFLGLTMTGIKTSPCDIFPDMEADYYLGDD